MANEIKQIKVGNTTYNIEPYSSYYRNGCSAFEMNSGGSLLGYGGFIDFHFFNSSGKPLNSEGTVVSTTPDYTSRIIEDSAGRIAINGNTYITWNGLTSSSITSNGSVDANSARITNGLYVGTYITHTEGKNLLIGNGSNNDYVEFVEDVQIGSLTINQSGHIGGITKISIGDSANASATGTIAIGVSAKAYNENSVAIGKSAQATGTRAVAIGYNTEVSGSDSIGILSTITGSNNISLGYTSSAKGTYNTVLGYGAHVYTGSYSTAIGSLADTYANYNVAIGYNAKAGKYSTTAAACMHGQIAIGYNATTTKGGTGSIVIGYLSSITGVSPAPSIVLGSNSTAYTQQTNDSYNFDKGEIVIGTRASSTGNGSNIVIGNGNSTYKALANGYNGIAIGSAAGGNWETTYGARVYGGHSIAIGSSAYATGSNAIAIGHSASASGSYAIAIGANISSGVSGSYGLVQIGNSSNNYTNHNGTTTSWSKRSDIRDKIDIEPLTDCLEVIKSIQPILYRDNPRFAYGGYFEYDEEEYKKGTKAYLEYCAGFKAQEVANIMEKRYGDEKFNHIVGHEFMHNDITGEDADYYTMSYGDLIPFVFQAVREQQEIIEELQEQNKILTEKIEEILKRVG